MRYSFLSFCLLSVATAFHVQPRVIVGVATARRAVLLGATAGGGATEPSINFNRAKECAENFGKCSVEEIEDLRASEYIFDAGFARSRS